MLEEKRSNWPKQLLKAAGILAVVLFVLAIIGFGLLVGMCGIAGRR